MRNFALLTCALVASLAYPTASALAQSEEASANMAVTGSAPQICSLQPANLAAGNQVNFTSVTGNLLQITALVDPTTLAANAASVVVSFEAVCNFPHRISLESENNGLWQTDGSLNQPADGFAYAVPYEAEVAWGEVRGRLEANANVRRISEQRLNVDQATSGEVELRISIQPGASNTRVNAPVLAGFYRDTLRIILEPR
jgi:hypothetical protein